MKRILIACEFSGRVRDAFRALGHDAVSCDLLPTESPGPHHQGPVEEILGGGWDLMIAHPPCTRLANSGVRWLHERDLWPEMRDAARFFRLLLDAPIPRVCVENPIPHKYALAEIGRDYDQIIHPWMFGDLESKATCLWLRGLEPLMPEVDSQPEGVGQSVWRASPSADRWKDRSRTFSGIARAMAAQWCNG